MMNFVLVRVYVTPSGVTKETQSRQPAASRLNLAYTSRHLPTIDQRALRVNVFARIALLRHQADLGDDAPHRAVVGDGPFSLGRGQPAHHRTQPGAGFGHLDTLVLVHAPDRAAVPFDRLAFRFDDGREQADDGDKEFDELHVGMLEVRFVGVDEMIVVKFVRLKLLTL